MKLITEIDTLKIFKDIIYITSAENKTNLVNKSGNDTVKPVWKNIQTSSLNHNRYSFQKN